MTLCSMTTLIALRVCMCACSVGDWTLGAAAYPSKKLAMSVRRRTEGVR